MLLEFCILSKILSHLFQSSFDFLIGNPWYLKNPYLIATVGFLCERKMKLSPLWWALQRLRKKCCFFSVYFPDPHPYIFRSVFDFTIKPIQCDPPYILIQREIQFRHLMDFTDAWMPFVYGVKNLWYLDTVKSLWLFWGHNLYSSILGEIFVGVRKVTEIER